MVKVAGKASKGTYAPDILAHELGHASLHGKNRFLMPARNLAPVVGSVSNIVTGTPWGLAGHIVPLADEGYASLKAMKTLKDWDIDEEDRRAARKRLGLGFSTYAVGPVVDAGVTIGALATDSLGLRIAAPLAGYVASAVVNPTLSESMDKIPIKGISEERARKLVQRTKPETDVYFAKKPMPSKGGFLSRPIIEPSKRMLADDEDRKELGAFIGHKASGKLLRKGGVVVSPSN